MSPIGWLPGVLRSAGLEVVEHAGWQDRGRVGVFAPGGVLVHHTGPGGDHMLVELCIRGRADLPGPLCHVVLTRDGVWHLIAGGKANHAGDGVLPWDLSGAVTGGNAQLIGVEVTNTGDGSDRYPDRQTWSLVDGLAAIHAHTGWGHNRTTTHADFARPRGRKNDPRGPAWVSPGPGTWTPADLRRAIAERETMPSAEEIADAVWARMIRSTAGVDSPAENVLRWAHHFAEQAATPEPAKPPAVVQVDVEQLAAAIARRIPGLSGEMIGQAVIDALRANPLGPAAG